MKVLSRGAIEIVIGLAQAAYAKGVCIPKPRIGQLVFEPTKLWCRGSSVGRVAADVDAIGWLIANGKAPYRDDPRSVHTETREVWDIIPLSGRRGQNGTRYLRWENAEFWALPDDITELVSG